MGVIEFALIGVGLAMDAFAVSICKGLAMRKVNMKQCLMLAGFFGGFQALMPFLGWLLGSQFAKYIQAYDHWIAFILLAYVGGKMIVDVIKDSVEGEKTKEEEEEHTDPPLPLTEVLMLAIATSIDALAVGITFALQEVRIGLAAAVIGIVTFFISGAGVFVGNIFGVKYKNKAQVVGGIILIGIGLRILLTDLGVF